MSESQGKMKSPSWQPTISAKTDSLLTPRPFPLPVSNAPQVQASEALEGYRKPQNGEMIENVRRYQQVGTTSQQTETTATNGRQLIAPAPRSMSYRIQPKMTIGEPGDRYEQEADQVASEVVQRLKAPASVQSRELRVPPISSLASPQDRFAQGKHKPEIQLQKDKGGGEATKELESSINSARGGGMPLEAGLQHSMGQAMGADFSGVRVHTDSRADQLNRSIQAKAFTTGQDVFFRQGEYKPGSRGGQELIAHELTHVLQQNGEGGGALMLRRNLTEEVIEPVAKAEEATPRRGAELEVSPLGTRHLRTGIQQESFIQRQLIVYKNVCERETGEAEEAAQSAAAVDKEVATAYDEFKGGNYEGASPAQIALYIKRKHEYELDKSKIHPSTAAGYVIEGKASSRLSPDGFKIQYSGLLAGTRPDVVIELKKSGRYALVDITAEKSIGHIFKKKGNWTNHRVIPYVAESYYPSLDFENEGDTAALTEEQKKEAIRRGMAAKEEKALAEREAYDMAEALFYQTHELLFDLHKKLYERAVMRNSGFKLTRRYLMRLRREFGLKEFKLDAGRREFYAKGLTYEEVIANEPKYKVPTHHLEDIRSQVEMWMGQLN